MEENQFKVISRLVGLVLAGRFFCLKIQAKKKTKIATKKKIIDPKSSSASVAHLRFFLGGFLLVLILNSA